MADGKAFNPGMSIGASAMKFTQPASNSIGLITAEPVWPSLVFTTDAPGIHTWRWKMEWGVYTRSGVASTTGPRWDARESIEGLGGALTVRATCGTANAQVVVQVRGTNPALTDITRYIATQADSAGFERIVQHESRGRHFNAQQVPIRSFDNGYGLCQLTNPLPSFEQVWHWQRNIDAGLVLFRQKRTAAIRHLSQGGRSYTTEQLRYETVARWNGGRYHDWDATGGGWVRRPNILCDDATGNIGWDMTNENNEGQTQAALRRRDRASYARGRREGDAWEYSGVCYADRLLA